jgi:prepilin-type processing-associated H-X9-DG protein
VNPARCGSNYNLYGIRYGASAEVPNVSTVTPAYWINFLQKYVTKNRLGTGATTAEEAADAQRSVLWGCPAFGKYASTAIGGFNRVQNGYGWNYVPTYTATYPALGVSYPPNYFAGTEPGKNSILDSNVLWVNNPTPTTGTWFKFNAYTRPAERCLAADAQFWIVEALAPPLTGVIPPQKISNNSVTYSAGVSGQTLFDFYRHGKYPPIEVYGNSGYYNANGGKVSFNILYCDGHVSNTPDRADAYRSVRMRFPG